jgi:hypothetical protein
MRSGRSGHARYDAPDPGVIDTEIRSLSASRLLVRRQRMSERRVDLPHTIVRGDPSQCWRYAAVGLVVGLIIAPLGGVMVSADDPPRHGLLASTVFIYGAIAFYAALHALWWFAMPGRVRYACDGETLWAMRGKRVLHETPCSRIRSMAWGGRHLSWPMVLLTVYPPIVPKLYVELDDPRGFSRSVGFPGILIWGKEPLRRAEVALAEAAGVEPGPAK